MAISKVSKNKLNSVKVLVEVLRIARPLHWTKNLALFAALIFSGGLLNPVLAIITFKAFVAFNFAASATYIFNDLKDRHLDRLHPIKKHRPLAAGTLPVEIALTEAVVLVAMSFYIASGLLQPLFIFSIVGYLILQAAYSLFLKNLPTIDIIVIATGFIIRVYAGAFVIDAHLSVWFLLCVISVALFLASGKRRAELNILDETKGVTRKSLVKYEKELLTSYVTMFGGAAWLSWSLFTFFESPPVALPVWLFLAELSRTTTISKLLMITIPVVIFAVMRYESLIFRGKSEAPERLLLTDIPLVTSVVTWTVIVVWVLYFTAGILI